MAYLYILYSKKIDKYYVGSCYNLKHRLSEHQNKQYTDSYTSRANDWILFYCIENLQYLQARLIQKHIKKMKSRKYIENLKKYEDISVRLINLYS